MKVSWQWLSSLVNLDGLTPEQVSEALTNAGLETEEIITVGPRFSGVVIGKTLATEQHPGADRLRLVDVDLGPLGQNRVVCGAPNVAAGMRIAYAQIGAEVISKKDDTLFKLGPAKIRGVESTGMICSVGELGLEDLYPPAEDGIWILDGLTADADLGKDLKEILNLPSDQVLDVAPTANRGDLMSMIGVAREVAALFDRPLTLPTEVSASAPVSSTYSVKLSNPEVCSFYTGAVLSGVKLGPAPDWMQQRLTAAGIRTINNVVDITNYVMLETGQPLHAFDIGKLGASGTVSVRPAKAGEKLTTLDDAERPLTENVSVVVTFNDTPVALAGVMGGQSTEIDDNTQSVFLETAYFPSASNRRSARSVGLRSESSARFERGIDPLGCDRAFMRAIELLQTHCGAKLDAVCADDHRQKTTPSVTLRLDRMRRILGVDVSPAVIEKTLGFLGFNAQKSADGQTYTVEIPSYRATDVTREIDVIEEIIRIYGYDNVPYTLPLETASPVKTARARLLTQVRQLMVGAGLAEVSTHSLIGQALLNRTGFSLDEATTVAVSNSQSIDHTVMRQSVLPNLLEIAKHNQDQGNAGVWLFELGRTYFKRQPATPKDSGVLEQLNLSAVMMGSVASGEWHQNTSTDFYTLKGVVDHVMRDLQLSDKCRWSSDSDNPAFHPGQTARLKLGKVDLGLVGRLHPAREAKLKFRLPVYLMELNVEALFEVIQKQSERLAVVALSSYPCVERDLAFVASREVTHQKILSTLNQLNDPLLQSVSLFDEYCGANLPEGSRSLAYRFTLQSLEGTLTDQAIEQSMKQIKHTLEEKLGVQQR